MKLQRSAKNHEIRGCVGVAETVIGRKRYIKRLCGACTMLVLLGVPWIFSAFGAMNTGGSRNLEILQGVFNVSERYTLAPVFPQFTARLNDTKHYPLC